MKRFKAKKTYFALVMLILGVFLITGCGSGGGEVTEHWAPADTTKPWVTAVVPLDGATSVAINTKIITAAFSEAMDPTTLTVASFTLWCDTAAGDTTQVQITGGGAVTYLAAGNIATLPLPAGTNLPADVTCTGTITTAATDLAGNPLASNYVWTFRTGVTPHIGRPIVISTLPATTISGPTTGVPNNTAITARFNEDMDPLTITAASFTLTGPGTTPVTARALDPVTYVVSSQKAIFWPAAALTTGVTYTATIKGLGASPAKDVALNALAGDSTLPLIPNDYVWTFTTVAAAPAANVSVLNTSIKPAAGAGGVCPSATISATFVVPSGLQMDDATVSAGTNFIVTGPSPAVTTVAGTISLDVATGLIATFRPDNPLAVGTYTVTIKGGASGVKDLAIPANTMVSDYRVPVWTFTVTTATGLCLATIPLGSTVETFGALSCKAISGSTMGPTGTTVNGNIGTTATSTSITNFPPSIVNGTIYASDLPAAGDLTSSIAQGEANTAFLAAQTVGAATANVITTDLGTAATFGDGTPGTFYAGAYQSASSIAISRPVTLDAQGDANAVWIFYAPSSLITSGTGNIILLHNAQAKNVFWVVGSSATLGAPLFSGNVLAAYAITVSTVGVTVDGRLLTAVTATCASVTFDANIHTVTVPNP